MLLYKVNVPDLKVLNTDGLMGLAHIEILTAKIKKEDTKMMLLFLTKLEAAWIFVARANDFLGWTI